MKKAILSGVAILAIGAGIWAAYDYLTDIGRKTTAPQFTSLAGSYDDGMLVRPGGQPVRVGFPPDYTYLGGQTFVLYGRMDVEQHIFVVPNTDGGVQSAGIVQIETVRPDVDWQYDYSNAPFTAQIGDFDFFADVYVGKRHPIYRNGRPGSDWNLALKFIKSNGFVIPSEYVFAHLVHLPTQDRREEILVSFFDDLAPTGYTFDDLKAGGAQADKEPDVTQAHLTKFKDMFWIEHAPD